MTIHVWTIILSISVCLVGSRPINFGAMDSLMFFTAVRHPLPRYLVEASNAPAALRRVRTPTICSMASQPTIELADCKPTNQPNG